MAGWRCLISSSACCLSLLAALPAHAAGRCLLATPGPTLQRPRFVLLDMALARSVCGALCVCVLALLAVLGVLAEWPAARQQFFVASHTKLEPDGVLFKISNTLAAVACFVGCRLDYIGCVKPMSIKDTAAAYGWEPGEGISITPGGWSDQSFMSVGFSHAAYKRVAHNPAAGRSPDMFIMSNISKLPVGVIPEGVAPSVLNFNTGHPEHSKR
jgi:hypothetical protein